MPKIKRSLNLSRKNLQYRIKRNSRTVSIVGSSTETENLHFVEVSEEVEIPSVIPNDSSMDDIFIATESSTNVNEIPPSFDSSQEVSPDSMNIAPIEDLACPDSAYSVTIPNFLNLPLDQFVAKLYTEFNMNRESGTFLLAYLHYNIDKNIPRDIRTLLRTPRHHNVHYVEPGFYIHCGIRKSLETLIKNESRIPVKILLDLFIDGLQIARSSKRGLWIVLAKLVAIKNVKPFIVGVYIGYQKPKNFNEFMDFTVNELLELRAGIKVKEILYTIDIHLVLGDSPARAAIAGILQFISFPQKYLFFFSIQNFQ
jgi:hypothetical protein